MVHCLCACLGVLLLCMCVCVCVCVCVHVRGSKYSLENPIKGDMYWFAVLFKAFWDISTDISFNVRASGRKQTNLLLLPPSFLSSLFSLFFLFSSLSVTPHQSLSTHSLFSIPFLFTSLCYCKMQHCRPSFFLSCSLHQV